MCPIVKSFTCQGNFNNQFSSECKPIKHLSRRVDRHFWGLIWQYVQNGLKEESYQ